jgi:hypothetical protein
MRLVQNPVVVAVDCVPGNQKCGLNKNEQRVYQGGQCGGACALEDGWGPFVFDTSVTGAARFSVVHYITVSSITYLLLEVRVTVKGMVHRLITTLMRKYSRCSFSRKIKNSAREGYGICPEHLI